jgi:Fe2+ transport system protein B
MEQSFIFGGSVVIWALSYIGPHGVNVQIDESFMHSIGTFTKPPSLEEYRIAIELTMTSLAKNPGINVAPAWYIYFWWFCSHLGIELHRSSWGECTD